MRPLVVALLVASLAFAGCTGDGGDEPSPSTSSSASKTSTSASATATTGPTSSGTSTSAGPSNRAPTGGLAVQVNGTTAAFNLTGTDPDGDALSWTLAFGDGTTNGTGSSLPAALQHDYAVGNFTARLTVTDGQLSDTKELALAIAAGPAEAFVITATYKGVDPAAAPPVGNPARQPSCTLGDPSTPGVGAVGGNWHVYDRDLTGWTFTVTPAKFVAIFYADDGSTRTGTFGSSGVVPADSVEVDICTSDPQAGGTYTFTALPP